MVCNPVYIVDISAHYDFVKAIISTSDFQLIGDSALFCNLFYADTKNAADHDESPPRTPTGNAPSSESDIDISSPNMSHDESIAKDMSMKDSGSDLSHRPKRRRFHESYNFNMKCPTPGCNSLGTEEPTPISTLQ